MVVISTVVRCINKNIKDFPVPKRRPKFVDSLRIFAKGGTGGHGIAKYGGVGGKGGDVYVEASNAQTLKKLYESDTTNTMRFAAKVGGHSKNRQLYGPVGQNVRIVVPTGVSVKTDTGIVVADVNKPGQRAVIAQGGQGGCQENLFMGQKGERRVLVLDLKLLADIGLVGFPNAGKSTLLSAVSRATPKIAEYPFTTLTPQIGVLAYDDKRQISMADLPGLIEGAHVNIGLGHKFLKHVERTKLLLFMVDVNGFQLGVDGLFRSAFETIVLLNKELEMYKPDLVDKPAVLVLNKVDSSDQQYKVDEIVDRLKGLPGSMETLHPDLHPENLIIFDKIIPVSAKYGHSIDTLKQSLRSIMDYNADFARGDMMSNNLVTLDEAKLRKKYAKLLV